MKSITRILLIIIGFSGVLSISGESSWALNIRDKTPVLESMFEKKLEEGLMAGIRYFYPSEIKRYLKIRTEVTLVPTRTQFAFRRLDYDIHAWTGLKTITIGSGARYSQDVCAEFVRLFESEDALFAYMGILAQRIKIFQDDIKDLLSESLVTKTTEFMLRSGKNPYGYLQFIEHLYFFLGKKINPKDLAHSKKLLDRLTGADDGQQYSFQPLPAKLLMKSYLETTMQILAKKLGVFDQFKTFKVDLSENDILDISIFNGHSDRRSLSLLLPRKWSEIFSNEDQLVALIVYALLWNQEASKKNSSWGPDSIEKLDRSVVDTLLALDMKSASDLGSARGYNPKEYFNLLTRIDRNPKKFGGLFKEIRQVLNTSQINPNTRITAVQGYLMKLEIKHADTFAQTCPFKVFAQKTKTTKSFKPKKALNPERPKPIVELEEEIEGMPSTITYQELTSYLTNNQEDPKLDLSASQLVRLLPATELTFPVLKLFFQQEKRKEAQKENHETRLPISVLTALNTFLSRLEEINLSDWVYWNSVYDLFQDGIVSQDKYPIPSRICEDWESHYLKLMAIQIEGTDFYIQQERAKLVKNLQNFSKSLGPCLNSFSKDKIFKLLMTSDKVDLALMIEWDNDNSYQKKYKSILKKKGVDDLNFLDSTIFHKKEGVASELAQKAIRKLPVEVLRLNALDKLDAQITHESYLKALVRRAGKLYYDAPNLQKLHSFVSRNKTLANSMRDQDRIRMTLAAIRQNEVPPNKILLPSSQNRLDMEKVVDALCEGHFSHVESLSLIVKMRVSSDSIRRYLDQKPLRSFKELIELLKKISEDEYRGLFGEKDVQYMIFRRISEQFPDQEYSVANLISLQQAILKTRAQLKLPGLNPVFFKALEVLQDPSELAQVHRIWLETMVATDSNEAEWVIKNGSQKDYLKAVLAVLEVEDENLILEYPALSSTDQARDRVFEILMKSDLSNEFIQKWIESVFAGKTKKSEQRKKEKFLMQLREQRPVRSLEEVANFLNQADYRTIVSSKMSPQLWKDCKHLFKTVPSAEFTSDKVKQFSSSIKDHSNTKFLQPISTLAVNGWYLKHTPKEETEQLVQIFESIRDAQKTYAQVSQTFCNQIESHFGKMVRAATRKDPVLLFDSFTPASFSKAVGKCQSKVNWEQELYRIMKKEGVDSKTILSMLIHRHQASLIVPFFQESYYDFDQEYDRTSSQLKALCNILSYIDDSNLRDKIAYALIFNVPNEEFTWENIFLFLSKIYNPKLRDKIAYDLIFNVPKKEVTSKSIFSFASSFKDGSYVPVYAMLRLLELSDDPHSLADIHSFLANYATKNQVNISSQEPCQVLVSNFDKMIKGSFAYRPAFMELKAFTPIQMGCYPENASRKSAEHKYKFRILMRAAETGAIDQEGILIEIQDSKTCKSRKEFERAIEKVKKLSPIDSFLDLEILLASTETRKKGFTLNRGIFDQLIDHFPDSQFERDKVRPVLKYLDYYDQRQILLRLAKVTHADEDMDFVVREGGGLVLTGERGFEKAMLGSIRQDPENLFRFPILTFAGMEWNMIVLHKDYYQDSFIQNQLIEYWMSSDAPKEYLLAWLRFLPAELGKRDRALRHFIQKAGLRSLKEWAALAKRAEKVIESKKGEEKWMQDKEKVIDILWNDITFSYLLASMPLSEVTAHKIVKFVKNQATRRLDIDKSYALNRALLQASSVKDYLEIHSELLSVKEVAPPAFFKSSEYMKSYMTMIRAVMDHNPKEALVFYDIPIQEITLKKYFSEDQAKRKRYAALDSLIDNLLVNYKHWPPGMAWVWITKYIPVVAESNDEGLASLFQASPRPRTKPTEAIIEVAARRGILSFKDIPTEIESAKTIDSSFALEPQTQKVILERLPRESFTFENLKSYADIDAVWTRQTLGESILATDQRSGESNAQDKKTFFELQLEQRKDRPDLLEIYLKTKKIITENPILTYDLENSEKMQKVFIDKMREGGAWPKKNLKQQHEILFSLAKRGPSELTDELLYNLYMKPSFQCWSCIEETMQNHAFWDLHRRKEIYEKYLQLTFQKFDEQSFKWTPEHVREYATKIVATVNLFFPVPSMERSEILERLANDIKASEKLTHMIDDEKGRGVNEEAALGLGLYLMNKVLNIYPTDEERMALVKFFVRDDKLPEPIAQRFRQQVGVNRLRRQFLELPAYAKALAINALIVNLLPKSTYRRELEHLIWNNVQEENRSLAKLFYRSFVKALQETAPFQESVFVAFLLGQLANVQGSHPGEKLKYILESLGGTGISIGQKIYQRRMLPDEYLEHLKNMTDHSPLPSRKAIYDRLRALLGVKKINQVLQFQEILGGASTALVVRVLFKDKKEAALKMTFEDLPKRTQVEFRKMEAALSYLVEDGGSTYNRLWPVIQEVHDGLKGQEDLTQEQDKTAKMRDLYESQNAYEDKVQFKVIQTLSDIGAGTSGFDRISSEHVFMELATGKTLTRLCEDQKKEVFPEIFKKEMNILLADPDESGMIYFEKDRHMGNFMADFSTVPTRIFVYDYPLFSSINVSERNSLFRLIGWLEARRMYGTNLFTQKLIDSKIAEVLATEIAQAQLNAGKVAKFLSTALADKGETSEKLFALFAIIDEVGTKDKIRVRPSLISYTIALGHAERYAQAVESSNEEGAFREMLRPHVLKSDAQFRKMVPSMREAVSLEMTQETFEQLSDYK